MQFPYLACIKISRPTAQKKTSDKEAEMRACAKMHGKCVRLQNVRQDNTMDTAGTLSLNLYEIGMVLKLVNLLIDVERVPSEIHESPYSNEDFNFP